MTRKPHKIQATGSEYAETIKAVLEGAATRDDPQKGKPKRRGPRRSKLPWMIAIVLLAAPYAVWENYRYLQHPEPPPADAQQRAARVMMFSAAQAVEQYRRQQGALPEDLSRLILPDASWQYVHSDTGYVLSVTMPNTSLSYRSGEDYRQLLREAGVP